MSSARSASAITSEPKPGAFAPAGVGRSMAATAGSAAMVFFAARAVADWDGVMVGVSSRLRLKRVGGAHPTGSRANSQGSSRASSRALAQPGEQAHSGIAVGRLHADLALEILHREHGVVTDAAVGAAGVVAERGEPALDFLDFGQRRGRLAAREFLYKRSAAEAAIAEMHQRQRVVHRRIVAADGKEIRTQQEGRSARHRHPGFCRSVGLRKILAVGALDAERRPGGIAARGLAAERPRHAHLKTPMLAAPIFAAFDEITGGRAER